jgi:hypothetical protein
MYSWPGQLWGGFGGATYRILGLDEGVVDGDDFDIGMLEAERRSVLAYGRVCHTRGLSDEGEFGPQWHPKKPHGWFGTENSASPDGDGEGSAHLLRKTIRPMRPKPLMPTLRGMIEGGIDGRGDAEEPEDGERRSKRLRTDRKRFLFIDG